MTRVPSPVFLLHAEADSKARRSLQAVLGELNSQGSISIFPAPVQGAEIASTIENQLQSARIIIPLVSTDFLADEHCHGSTRQRQVLQAIQRGSQVIPLLLSPCDWQGTYLHRRRPFLSKPISDHRPQKIAYSRVADLLRARLRPRDSGIEGDFLLDHEGCKLIWTPNLRSGKQAGFWMGETPVTQRTWCGLDLENPSYFQDQRTVVAQAQALDLPVENVTWYEAVKLANLLSLRSNLQAAYDIDGEKVRRTDDANGYRLPTRQEWQAARSMAKRREQAAAKPCFWESSRMGTRSLGDSELGEVDLQDFFGNVWEWSDDLADPRAPYRLAHGGSWRTPLASRDDTDGPRTWFPPNHRSPTLGLRLVLPATSAR